MKGVIIYDFDGVIVNSGHAVLKYYDVVFERFNLPKLNWHDAEIRRKAFAMSHRQLMSQYAAGELLEEMCSYVPPFTMEQMLQITPLEPEVNTVIPCLSKDYHLAICTNRATSVQPYLEHFGLDKDFSFFITASDVTEAKPSPEGVFKILEHFGTKNALYVGDSETDYLAARDSGSRFLAYGMELRDATVIYRHSEIFDHL